MFGTMTAADPEAWADTRGAAATRLCVVVTFGYLKFCRRHKTQWKQVEKGMRNPLQLAYVQ